MTVNQELLLDTRRVQRQCIEITLTLFGRPPQDMDKTTLQQPQKGWRVALMPPWAPRHIDGSRQGHPRYTDARNNVHGGGALLSPSSAKIQQQQNDDTLDKKLTDCLWAVASNRDREHKDTTDRSDQSQEGGVHQRSLE